MHDGQRGSILHAEISAHVSKMSNPKRRLEEDGLYVQSKDHWEMWEAPLYRTTQRKKYRTKEGEKHYTNTSFSIHVPKDLIRHLSLKPKDKILVAIKKHERK